MMNPQAVVWHDSVHKSRWWALVYNNGKGDWLQYGFRSAKKAQEAVDEILRSKA